MCRGGGHPDIGGSVIASLERGDEIIVKKGYGHPKAKKDSTEIIALVGGFSALTAEGRRLNCRDGMGIVPTGNHVDDFQLSEETQKILDEINE